MDRSWIHIKNRLDPRYLSGAAEFMKIAINFPDIDGLISCPCVRCHNARRYRAQTVEAHVYDYGFSSTYTIWVYHGERLSDVLGETSNAAEELGTSSEHDDRVEDLLHDVFRNDDAHVDLEPSSSRRNENPEVEKLFADLETPLFPGCKSFSKLSFLLRLMHVKVTGKVTNSAMDSFLQLLSEAFFEDGSFPKSHYEAKKYLRTLGLGYESIHACKFDCALFWKENEDLHVCPICGTSRWAQTTKKGKKIPHKVLRYFPVSSRLKRIYSCRESARLMRWHDIGRSKESGVLRHPADGKAWQHFDSLYPDFAGDARNVRLGLASDGFNPFGNMSLSYSMWPVILIPYNMPPQLCMDASSFMLTLLIPGPGSPGKDIDVYLQPLIDELKQLWSIGTRVYDSHSQEMFTMRAALIWTINDFPAYGYLCGRSNSGYKACPTCNDDTTSVRLREKIGFTGHRRYLPGDHVWRRSRNFDGKQEIREPPTPVTADECLRQLNRIPSLIPGKHKDFGGKKRKRDPRELNWTRRTIFFDLPYWHTLLLRHNLDVMHVEKNFADNLVTTMFDVKGKTKDTKEAREDLRDMRIRPELHLTEVNGRIMKPQASYVLTKAERKKFCAFMKTLRFPYGFAGNLARNVDEEDGKIFGLKSHDCHVFLQRVLPIGCRSFFTKQIRDTLVELSKFFQIITCRTLRVTDLEQLQDAIVILLCKLERIFPPAFFTIMVHLLVHLPSEAILGGPVHSRWMYPVERYIGRLKRFVRNRARPEGSIAEGYVVDEALTFCSRYLKGVDSKFVRPNKVVDRSFVLDVFRPSGRPIKGAKFTSLSSSLFEKAQWFVLNNCTAVEPFIAEHMSLLQRENIQGNLEHIQENSFASWFRKKIGDLYVQNSSLITDELFSLSCGPDQRVRTYSGYVVNGVKFLTREVDEDRKTQNSGVSVPGIHAGVESDYNGVLEEIIQLDYPKNCSVVLFRCKWFDSDRRRRHVIYEPNHTIIDTSWEIYKEDPFVFADQVQQVYYIVDPNRISQVAKWQIIEKFTHRHLLDIPDDDFNDYVSDLRSPSTTLSIDVGDFDDILVTRSDVDPEQVVETDIVSRVEVETDDDVNDKYDDELVDDDDEDENESLSDKSNDNSDYDD